MKHYIRINGYTVSYYEAGQGDTTLLFLHGNSLSSETFHKQLKSSKLLENYRIITPDLLGHGNSDYVYEWRQEYHISFQAKYINKLLDRLNVDKVLLCGHSLGGNILIEAAIDQPRVKGLVLIDSVPANKPLDNSVYQPNPVISNFFKGVLTDDEIAAMHPLLFSPSFDGNNLFTETIKHTDKRTRKALALLVSQGNYNDQFETLKQLALPVIGIFGEDEQLYNLEVIKNSYKQAFNDLILLPKCGHMPFVERPEAFNEIMVSRVMNTINSATVKH